MKGEPIRLKASDKPPFPCRQYLTVQVQYGNKYPQYPVNLIPSATSTQLDAPKTGDQLSGWTVNEVYVQPFNLSEQMLLRAGTESLVHDTSYLAVVLSMLH